MDYGDAAQYLRMRLLGLHEKNRILYPRRVWKKMERCILEKTSAENIRRVLDRILPATVTAEFAREIEFALIEAHGQDRYFEHPEFLRSDIEKASVKFRTMAAMDEIYESCGAPKLRSHEDRIGDAAWFSVPKV